MMASSSQARVCKPENRRLGFWEKLFSALAGIWIAVTVVKFGNPVILDTLVQPPQSGMEFLISGWPIRWGYILVGVLFVASLPFWRWKGAPLTSALSPSDGKGGLEVRRTPDERGMKWLLALPFLWYFWQLCSSTESVRPDLTDGTIFHFAACLASLCVGYFGLSKVRNLIPFWVGLLIGLFVVFWVGFDQHYGGLEQTRHAFEELKTNAVQGPLLQKFDTPEFRKKISSNRIFSTFVYPNALAGAVLLFLPSTLFALWQMSHRASSFSRQLLVGLWAFAGLACLYWSGSKAGWLICLGLLFCAFLHLAIPKKLKWCAAVILLVLGIGGFAVKYSGYFSKGATSAVARTDYWRAALQLSLEKPILGSGPGTFMEGYKRLKNPESEMTRLAHNDYLQQAADSGWPGFLLYSVFIWGGIFLIYRNWRVHAKTEPPDWLAFAIWLGVAAFVVQSLVEFGLYIPALAWPFFLLLGFLWRQSGPQNRIDKNSVPQ